MREVVHISLRKHLLLVLFWWSSAMYGQTGTLVFPGAGGKLEYKLYANWGQADLVNTIPDFSFAGYKGGGVALPKVPVAETITPVTGDARAILQAAIDRVSAKLPDANGFRGAILLKSGRYEVNGSLFIRASGVVLVGEGQNTPDKGGTEVVATSPTQHDFIQIRGSETAVAATGAKRIRTAIVPTGARSFDVDDPSGLAVGDTIKVTRTPNDTWINTLAMAQYGWIASEYRISYERTITAINGKTLTVAAPMVQTIDTTYGGGEVSKFSVRGRVSSSGVENMLISSIYASDVDESHGWSAITLSQTTDCWVRRVTARYFGYSCVGLYWAYNTTVEDCAMLDPKSITTGSRKYSFYIDKGSFNLFQRCYTRGGRHDYVTGSRVAGPNVFVDCYSTQTYADIGPHHRYATGVLFDNIRGGETRVQNRKEMGTGHGWAGAQTMFWNCQSDVSEFKVESPIGAMNWGIGCTGVAQTGAGFWESWKTRVTPRSLYYQQLQDRLGAAAVANVTFPEQRQGKEIWPILISWAGVGALTTAVDETGEQLPGECSLHQNYPNPFNPSTAISYQLSAVSLVTLRVYDILGREVATLAEGMKGPGAYKARWDGSASAGGVYLYRLEARPIGGPAELARFGETRKMLLFK